MGPLYLGSPTTAIAQAPQGTLDPNEWEFHLLDCNRCSTPTTKQLPGNNTSHDPVTLLYIRDPWGTTPELDPVWRPWHRQNLYLLSNLPSGSGTF